MLTDTTARASQLAGLSIATAQIASNPLDHTAIALIGMLSAQAASILIAWFKARGDAARARLEADRQAADLANAREDREFEREQRAAEREAMRDAIRAQRARAD